MKRRDLLAAAPAAALVPAALAGSGPEDPVLPLYREWLAAQAETHRLAYMPGNEDLDLPEYRAAEEREEAAFKAIVGISGPRPAWRALQRSPTSS